MNDEVRSAHGVSAVNTKFGTLAYRWDGPDTGRVVVLVHGFSTPSFVFDKNIGDLSSSGFRVLRFDHFGRGFSDRPKVDYNQDFYDETILTLLQALDVTGPIDMLGYSMGGGIVTTFAARHPERVHKIALIAPVGMSSRRDYWRNLLRIPGFGEWICEFPVPSTLIRGFKKDLAKGVVTREMFQAFKDQFKYSRTTSALLSTLRHYPMSALHREYYAVEEASIPVALIWGTDDGVVPYRAHREIVEILDKVQFTSIEGDHGIPYSHAMEVNKALLDFFTETK